MQRTGPRLTVRGIGKDISNLGKELERDQDEVGTSGAAFAFSQAEVFRIASKIEGVRERSKGGGRRFIGKMPVNGGHIAGGRAP